MPPVALTEAQVVISYFFIYFILIRVHRVCPNNYCNTKGNSYCYGEMHTDGVLTI